MDVKLLLSLLLCVVIQINNASHADPCSTVDCGPFKTCRLQQVYCYVPPCPPYPVCDSRVVDPSKCGPGSGPVLDISKKEINCGVGSSEAACPDSTVCILDPDGKFGVCCWLVQRPFVNKRGRCPRQKPGFGVCTAQCSHDGNCPGQQKCCGSCPRRCTNPVIKPKPGSCPTPGPGFGICIVRCSNDYDCPGKLKCCGSCPRECKYPVSKPKPGRCPRYSWYPRCTNQLRCRTDSHCPGKLKCCSSRCGSKICLTPVNQYPWW